MGAVAILFSTFTGTFALPEHVLSFITQTSDTELCLSHDLGFLPRGLFLKDTKLLPLKHLLFLLLSCCYPQSSV